MKHHIIFILLLLFTNISGTTRTSQIQAVPPECYKQPRIEDVIFENSRRELDLLEQELKTLSNKLESIKTLTT